MFTVISYTPSLRTAWNTFVAQSKNGTFLFDRSYMDYHADRFTDASLMVYDRKGRLFAIMPANRVGDILYSHQGLTYGGLILLPKATAVDVCDAMTAICDFLRSQGATKVIYKAVPWIYSAIPSDEPLYALSEVCHARLISRDIASVVSLVRYTAAWPQSPSPALPQSAPLASLQSSPIAELRLRGKKKAARHGIRIDFSDDFPAFWRILTENLRAKYGSKPVHALDEILLLKSRFPRNILLCAAFEGSEMVAGTVLYLTPRVVKTQYISASPRGKEVCALDMLFLHLLSTSHVFDASLQYFDMGTSALDHSNELRRPLIFHKEGFGARAVCYDTYEWQL